MFCHSDSLYIAFATDPFIAYDQFVARRLNSSEFVDVYIADLRRLSTLKGGLSDRGLACAFVAALPEDKGCLFRASSRMDTLDVNHLSEQTRAILNDDTPVVQLMVSAAKPEQMVTDAIPNNDPLIDVASHRCSGADYLARYYLSRGTWQRRSRTLLSL